jgi:hypothetical protein
MKQITLTLDAQQEQIIADAIEGTRHSADSWLNKRVESLLNSQRTANLASSLRGFAQQAKVMMRWDSQLSVEECVIKFGISGKVTEYGGLGAFFKLMNSDYSADRVNSKKPIAVSAAQVAETVKK